MQSTNFQPLKSRWPYLYEHARFAEEYVYSDPHTATIQLRCFAESLVGILYRELNLPCKPTEGFFEKLKAAVFQEVVDEAVLQKLHAIRVLGNKAAHGRRIDKDDTLSLIKEAYLIGQWFYKTCSADVYSEYPAYIVPVKPVDRLSELSQAKEVLARQLLAAKEELDRLEKSEKAALIDAAALNQSLDQVKLEAFKNSAAQAASTIDFQVETTRSLINIHDIFTEYTLNEGQVELINRLNQFLSSGEYNVFLLKGYAGTGKTFITKGLTEYFRAIGRNYVLAAPTGKASKVIALKTKSTAYTIHKTIYSFDDIVEYRDDDIDGTETFKFYAKLAVNENSVDTVYIVDEASMISDIYQEAEFFRFGTGYLLADFIKFVNLDHNDHRKKVIFIGDDAQLPPVGMDFSPALNSKYLLQKHHLHSTAFELTEVVRQKAESGVIKNTIPIRKALDEKVFNQLDVDLNYPDLKQVDHQDLISFYLESCDNKINGESIIIAHSNGDVADYNNKVRECFFPNCQEIVSGDKVMALTNSNVHRIFISNGDFGKIREVIGDSEKRRITLKKKNPESKNVEEIQVELVFRDVIIGFKSLDDTTHFFPAKIIENLLYNKEPGLSSDQNKALYLDFCIRNKNIPRKSIEFKQLLKIDPYFNALRLKFGYAITCHKAQGSEWNNVFVKCKSHQSQLTSDYFRWLYTAMTRTAQKLYLLDPPHIKLGSGIKPIQNLDIPLGKQPINEIGCSQKNSFTDLPDTRDTFGIPQNASFLLTILKEIRKLVDEKGIVIDGINHHQHQETYIFKRGDEIARIDVRYNNKSKITYITTPQPTEMSNEIIKTLLPLQGLLVVINTTESIHEFNFDKPFLNDFHQRILTLTSENSITIQNVVEQQWFQRYTFFWSGEVAVYDIWYNGKSQFTHCQPVRAQCSAGTLVSKIEKLLTKDMGL